MIASFVDCNKRGKRLKDGCFSSESARTFRNESAKTKGIGDEVPMLMENSGIMMVNNG